MNRRGEEREESRDEKCSEHRHLAAEDEALFLRGAGTAENGESGEAERAES